jgi:hypothetical protein
VSIFSEGPNFLADRDKAEKFCPEMATLGVSCVTEVVLVGVMHLLQSVNVFTTA